MNKDTTQDGKSNIANHFFLKKKKKKSRRRKEKRKKERNRQYKDTEICYVHLTHVCVCDKCTIIIILFKFLYSQFQNFVGDTQQI